MATNTKTIKPIDIPFKEFMAGQIIESVQFNDDMRDIEDKTNEIIDEYNVLSTEFSTHTDNFENPHNVTAEQTGAYTIEDVDGFLDEIRKGGLDDGSIKNRVLADNCVENRNYKDGSITVNKFDDTVGSQLDISKNTSIIDRYTKTETDELIKTKVGDGTYTKEELDKIFEDIQAGEIVEGTIGIEKLKPDVGLKLDITKNPALAGFIKEIDVNNKLTKYAPLNITGEKLLLKNHTQDYIGATREITFDSTDKTLRVHDGTTPNGLALLNKNDYSNLYNYINDEIKKLSSNLGGSHNHDDKYSKLGHKHTEYYEKVGGNSVVTSKVENSYPGLNVGSDNTTWLRTTKNGIIPFDNTGTSSVGSSSWKFNAGYFNTLNSNLAITDKLIVKGGMIDFNEGVGQINFANNDMMYYNDETNEYIFEADDSKLKSRLCTGSLEVNNRRIYVGSSFPSDARVNDILIQI